jgi:hypothetical protein
MWKFDAAAQRRMASVIDRHLTLITLTGLPTIYPPAMC